MDEREGARAEISDSRERIKEIASQLAERAKPTYMKERAKEAAVQKSVELKNRIARSPVALGIIGGITTAGIAKLVMHPRQRNGEMHPREGNGNGEMAREFEPDKPVVSEKAGQLKEKAGALKEKAREKVGNLRERMPSGEEVKTKVRALTARAGEEPIVTVLGALAIGAALGFLLPLTQRERRMLEPAREEISEKLESLSTKVGDKVHEKVDELHEKIAGD